MPFDQIGDVAEAASLLALTVERDRLAPKRLFHEVGEDPAVVQAHPRAVGVEDAHDPRLDAVIAMIGHRDGLGEPLGLVVAAPGPDGIDVAPVVFALRVNLGVAVDLGGAGEQEPRILGLGQPQRIMSAERPDLERRNGVSEVIDRARRTGEMEDVVDLAVDLDRLGDIVLDEPETGVLEQACDVSASAGQQIVHADDLVAVAQETLAEMRSDEPRPAGDDRSQRVPSRTGKSCDRPIHSALLDQSQDTRSDD